MNEKLITTVLLIAVFLMASFVNDSHAQFSEDMPEERYEQAWSLMNRNLAGTVFNNSVNTSWINDHAFYYTVNDRDGMLYYLVDANSQTRELLFDNDSMAELLSIADDDAEINAERLPISIQSVSDDFSEVYFTYSNREWVFDRINGGVGELGSLSDISRPAASVLSPDGRHAAYIQNHNLFVRNMETGEDTQLTTDGEEGFGYATDSQGWSSSARPILYWSADGSMISTYQLDEKDVELMHLLRTADGRPELVSWPYALPGDEHVPMHHRVVINLESGEMVRIQSDPYHQRTSNCCGLTRGAYWADNQFSASGDMLAYVGTSRDYKDVTLKIADTSTGEVREIFHEHDEIFIETNLTSRGVPNWRVLFDSNEFIWFSRQDNWGHLYLHDLNTGELKNQITTGSWNVVDIIHVDEEERRIWFSGVGMDEERDPYQEYYYSISFDGSDLRTYTPDEGNHSVVFSPGFDYLVDTFSDFTTPQVTVLRDHSGEILMELEQADIEDLLATGWRMPVPFSAKARDGVTDVYGVMYLPSDFDENKKYPVVINIYPGPQVGSVGGRSFSPLRRGNTHAIAELGFVVLQIDAFGTPMRSREFHTYYYGDMADNGLPDQKSATIDLAERYSFIDVDRVGMYGHSGGGFATTAALFNHSDFFKVGVAGAGNLDNRGYTFYWGEKFQGQLTVDEDGVDSFENQALQLQAENLGGKLLLSYGTMDNNVHPNMTHLVINELIRHNKDFDLIVLPNRNHGYANENYKMRRTMDYFVKHLMHVNPPKEFSPTN